MCFVSSESCLFFLKDGCNLSTWTVRFPWSLDDAPLYRELGEHSKLSGQARWYSSCIIPQIRSVHKHEQDVLCFMLQLWVMEVRDLSYLNHFHFPLSFFKGTPGSPTSLNCCIFIRHFQPFLSMQGCLPWRWPYLLWSQVKLKLTHTTFLHHGGNSQLFVLIIKLNCWHWMSLNVL